MNILGHYGRWVFAEFTDMYRMQHNFEEKVAAEFNEMIDVLLRAGRISVKVNNHLGDEVMIVFRV